MAFHRAVELMAAAAKDLPRADVDASVKLLMSADSYGMRRGLHHVTGAAP